MSRFTLESGCAFDLIWRLTVRTSKHKKESAPWQNVWGLHANNFHENWGFRQDGRPNRYVLALQTHACAATRTEGFPTPFVTSHRILSGYRCVKACEPTGSYTATHMINIGVVHVVEGIYNFFFNCLSSQACACMLFMNWQTCMKWIVRISKGPQAIPGRTCGSPLWRHGHRTSNQKLGLKTSELRFYA